MTLARHAVPTAARPASLLAAPALAVVAPAALLLRVLTLAALAWASPAAAKPLPPEQQIAVDVRRVTLVVRDVERSLAVYRDALGLRVVYDQLIGGGSDADGKPKPPTIRLVLLRANDDFVGLLGLMQRLDDTPPPPPEPPGRARAGQPILVINARDLEARFPKLAATPGVTVSTAPTPVEYPAPGGGTIPVLFSAVWDPDGFFVELNQLRGTPAGAAAGPKDGESTDAASRDPASKDAVPKDPASKDPASQDAAPKDRASHGAESASAP